MPSQADDMSTVTLDTICCVLMQANKVYSFRRGSRPAPIHSLAFSPLDIQPPLLCATSGHGTVHIFRLEQPDRFVHPLMTTQHLNYLAFCGSIRQAPASINIC